MNNIHFLNTLFCENENNLFEKTGRMQDSADVGQVKCRKGQKQNRTTSVQVRCRTVWMLDRTDAGKDGYKTGQVHDRTSQIQDSMQEMTYA